MREIVFSTCCLLLIMSIGCKKKEVSQSHNDEPEHWSYEGETAPEHWAEIEKRSDCSGKKQSPINIIDIDVVNSTDTDDLAFLYHPKTSITEVKNNGHSIEFDFELGDSIQYKNDIFHLKQIHFHEPSEHTINGVRYPLEIHFVHKSDSNNLTVISILAKEGEESSLFEFLESFLPLNVGETSEINRNVDLASLYPKSDEYYSYNGSLTTPPCSENVNWIVFKEPIIISESQVLTLQENMPINNYRDEQPLNGRKVSLSINN